MGAFFEIIKRELKRLKDEKFLDSLIKDLTPTVIDNSEVYQLDSNLKITYVKDNNIITNIIVNDSYNTYDLKYTKINKIPTIGETYEY